MAIFVKTGNKDLKFRVQGKLVDFETAVPVKMDHNVQQKLKIKSLVRVSRPAAKPKDK